MKKSSKSKPVFVVLCGGEGSGKSTVVKMLGEKYPTGSDPKLVITREPGGSPYAEDIRKLMFGHPLAKNANAETMFGLFWAARADHMKHLVLPALASGKNVVSDRADCCTYAYQIYGQKNTSLKNLFWQTREVYLAARKPDLYIFLDVLPEEGLKRVAGRAGKKNHFDNRDIAFHRAVSQGYLAFFDELRLRSDSSRSIIVDANQSLESVCVEVDAIISKMLK